MMERSGVPLEIRARRLLEGLGFAAFRTYYEIDGLSHELDFIAWKDMGEVTLPFNFTVSFYLYLIGECKYSESDDYFAFKADDQRSISLSDLPVRFSRENFGPLDLELRSASQLYRFPMTAERIVQVNSVHYTNRRDGNYGDRSTFEACEQLASACRYFKESHLANDDMERKPLFAEVEHEYADLQRKNPTSEQTAIVNELVANHSKELFGQFDFWAIHLAAPILVLDDKRGLVKTTLSRDGAVHFDEEIGTLLYPHVPRTVASPREPGFLGPGEVLPVAVCKYSSMSTAVEILEKGTRQVVDMTIQFIKENPNSVVLNLIATELMLRGTRPTVT